MPTRKTRRQPARSRRQELLGAVLGQPWAITPAGLEQVLTRAAEQLRQPVEAIARETEALAAESEETVEYSYRLRIRHGVGHIRCYGPLVSASSVFGWYYDNYEVLAAEITGALRDPRVRALVLTFDSPGGHVNGCQELARIIREARGVKPIVAFVEGDACSAAYWLASACDEIVAGETAVLGCLGAQVAYLDDAKLLEAWGLREITITSSQTPEKNRPPTDDSGRRVWQQMVDDIADVFLNTVATYRGVSREQVDAQFGQGAILVGARAVTAGLADRVGTYEALHAELAGGTWRRPGAPPSDASTVATATQLTGEPMPPLRRIGAKRSANTAAAFESNADVRALVTRETSISEGDIGTVSEVRDGSFYRVAVGDSEYGWLAEDELEAVAAPTEGDPPPSPDENATASDDETSDDEEQPTASRQAARRAKPSAFQAALAGARAAERQRITGILALRTKASVDALVQLIADPACTPEAAAHRLLTGTVRGARPEALGQLAGDEAALTAQGGLRSTDDFSGSLEPENPIVAALRVTNPRALVSGAARTARTTPGA